MVFDSVLKLRTFISISLLLLDHSHGIFELVPSGQVYVCTQSDLNQLEVVCSSNESRFLEWSITFPASNNYMRSIWDTNVAGYVRPLTVGSVTFEFTITKNPLTSRVSASQISPILNGSVIMCREAIGNSAELVLHVVDATTAGSPTIPVVQVSSEQFRRDNVTVILEWPNEGGGVSYSASVMPEGLSAEMLTGNDTSTGIKLVLLYNTQYNLSIVATLCEEENNATSIIELNYVNCGEPITNPNVNLEYSSTLVGSQLLLWCGDGDNVTTAWCSESATWTPGPDELVCPPSLTSITATMSESNTIRMHMLIGICVSVGVLFGGICVVITILIIMVIIRRGLGRQKDKESIAAVEHQEKDINMSKNIVYEQVNCRKQKIVLQENVAYCSTSECISSII